MSRIILFHGNVREAGERVRMLRRSDHEVTIYKGQGVVGMHAVRENPPDAFVIDLDRVPSLGRAVAVWLRQQKATRHVSIVFVGGDPEKVKQIRKLIPDAVYTEWKRVRSSIRSAIEHSPRDPVVPGTMDSYTGTPLDKKLGIREGSGVALLGAPAGFERALGHLPDTVRLRRQARSRSDVILLFVKSHGELSRRFPAAARCLADGGRLWIVWPKKTSGAATDLSLNAVRSFGLDAGFVDYKISKIDETWSGLCFARRNQTA